MYVLGTTFLPMWRPGRLYSYSQEAEFYLSQIKQAVMRHAILANNASAVDAEGDRQSLDGDIMDDGVIAALQEGAVDDTVGVHAVLGKTARKGHRVTLADTHVKGA